MIVRNVRAEDNGDAGIFWEIKHGWVRIEDSQVHRNGRAANIDISNGRGTTSNPIIIHNNTTWGISPAGRSGLLGNGLRAPLLGYVSVLNNVTPKIQVALTNSHAQPVAMVVSGNVTADGTLVGLG